MTYILPDLRPLLADLLDDHSQHHLRLGHIKLDVAVIAHEGAETLRWCARFEEDRERPGLAVEVERLEAILDRIDEALELPKAVELRAEIAKALAQW
jgi:hypothetical protein